ncbi:hypothetical protein M422DRAFT_185048 [Sphaerobolus stellatus SS14]|uniref:Peroxisomal membrane protein PEX16 n=1 Tax=Sphaerobolus stellatus (strain SS14) TaxID=990650 RepID=A0A0C9TPP3_SPHS4|nr:hypothetical protein M422DRAFT_185048 [Sphaerobolus stellatus SS14]
MSPLHHYENFLIHNSSTIATIESSLRSITWFLPGRFKDAELASEALSATLNLLSLYHDTIIARRLKQCSKFKPIIPPTLNSRYTRAWGDKDSLYKWAARLLETLRFLELLMEMGLRRKFGQKGRWRGVITLEVIKAVLRLLLLKITRRPLVTPPLPERELDPANLPSLDIESSASAPTTQPTETPVSGPSTPEHLKNNHISLDAPNPLLSEKPTGRSSPIENYLLPKALSPTSVKPPTTLLRPFGTPLDWISEVLYVLRPLIYVVALSRDDKTSRPLVISLALDFASRYLRRSPPASATLERAEYAHRDRDLLWYFFRGQIWETYTRPKFVGFADKTASTPLLGLLSAFVKDWVPLIDDYYYCKLCCIYPVQSYSD